jgi:alcohol dehydrogenase class IV
MMFEFATAGRVIFGRDTADRLPDLCRELGKRALLVTGAQPDRHTSALAGLEAAGLVVTRFPVAGEPTTNTIRHGAEAARQAGAELVIGLGGGSAIDAAKAIAAMATQPGDLFDYLEVIGHGRPLAAKPLPVIAVPTTAGTGAEVTRNAVLTSPEHGVKVSLRHLSMLPAVALVDPGLARGCPPEVTAASGMDALTQCLEAYVSRRAQPMTDGLCLEGIRRAARSLETAVRDGGNLDAREDLALAALFSGIALANAGLGAVHGFAAPIGGRFHAPHGAVCAALLAPVWEANLRKLRAVGQTDGLERFRTIARLLVPEANEPEAASAFLHGLARRLSIPGLGVYGIDASDLDSLATQAAAASSMKGNPVELQHEELVAILEAAR